VTGPLKTVVSRATVRLAILAKGVRGMGVLLNWLCGPVEFEGERPWRCGHSAGTALACGRDGTDGARAATDRRVMLTYL
jgi:hypothetical protein